ncbi:MAG: LON peptidase substrate-binding domain-containing protein [Pseudomonadota bacterium]
MSSTPTTVALFPIPDLVAFPGTIVPLHVFEPRYRQLLNDSIEQERLIGIPNTRKQIHPGRKHESVEEALASNQATYQPHEVFSAGRGEIVETLDDGRIHAVIRVEQRLVLGQEVQTLPYRIVEATPLDDEPDGAEDVSRELQREINGRLVRIVADESPELADALEQDDWCSLSPAAFSFKIFQFLRFDPDLMQSVLETTQVSKRLKVIDDVLQSAS